MKRGALFLMFITLVMASSSASAGVITNETFNLFGSNGALSGGAFSVSKALSSDGVNFTATLNVVGSASVTQDAQGLGVQDATNPTAVNGSEWLGFTMSITGITGGTVNFDTFQLLTSVISPSRALELASENTFAAPFLTTAANATTASVNTGGTDRTAFFVRGVTGLGSFKAQSITAQFTTTAGSAAVPEPGSIGLLCAIGLALGVRHRRRRNA